MEVYWGSSVIAPLVSNFGTRHKCVTSGEKTLYALNSLLAGPRNWCGWFLRRQNVLPFPEFEPRVLQPVASCCTDCTDPVPEYLSYWLIILRTVETWCQCWYCNAALVLDVLIIWIMVLCSVSFQVFMAVVDQLVIFWVFARCSS
jgi:hypothetical protein